MVRYVTHEEFSYVTSALAKGLERVETDLREHRDETRLLGVSLRADIADLRQDVTRLDEKVDLILRKISKN